MSEKTKEATKENSTLRETIGMLIYVVVLVVLFMLIRHFLFVPVSVDGPSMVPTLADGDRLILDKTSEIEHFDVVVFTAPDDPDSQYIKRVIGLPGDTVSYKNNVLTVNDQVIEESFDEDLVPSDYDTNDGYMNFTLESLTNGETSVVPDGKYFVLGDNRTNSKDSRIFGFVDAEDIMGVSEIRFWPLTDAGLFNKMDDQYRK